MIASAFTLWKLLFGIWSLGSTGNLSAPETDAGALASSCETCHAAQVEEWSRSRHAVAFSNGLFRVEFDRKRTAWCASCHAPSADDPRTVRDDDPLAMQGVGCMSCHHDKQRGKGMVSRNKARTSPHDTRASQEFGSASFCAGCHEFSFPKMGQDGMPTGFLHLPMQETVSQFRQTSAAAEGGDCRQCHMATPGKHLFPGSHDRETLRLALHLETCRSDGQLQIELGNVGAAHAVPTGGVNRHLVLRTWRSSAPKHMVEQFIGRRFAGDAQSGKRLLVDTTLAAGESRRYLVPLASLRGSRDEAVNVELRYIYPLEEFAPLPPGTRRSESVARTRSEVSDIRSCQPAP